MRQVSGFLCVLRFSPAINLTVYYLSAMFASYFSEYETLARMGGYDGK
jgi:hypothetical protein